MKHRTTKAEHRPFNMVEIVVALVIILVALIGILGLMPHSIEANNDAMQRAAAGDAADQFLHHFAARITENWVENETLPETKPTKPTKDVLFSKNSLLGDDSTLKISFDAANEIGRAHV